MKVAVIGYGNVGMAVFRTLLEMPDVHELALIGRNRRKIKGELGDFLDAMAINTGIRTKISGGGYEETADADIIIYSIGPSAKNSSQTRLDILKDALEVTKAACVELNRYNKDALIVVISNPVDIMVKAIMKYTGRPAEKVIGTGTLLDSARLRREIAEILEITPSNVSAFVLGEHGGSSVIAFSWLKILGMSLDEFFSADIDEKMKVRKDMLLKYNRFSGDKILDNKGNTCHGVAAATARIVSDIIHDSHEILPVSVYLENRFGIKNTALSVPCYVTARGAFPIARLKLTEEEFAALHASAAVLHDAENGML